MQVGIKLNGTGVEVPLDNFHKTIGEQQDYVQMVYEEFLESCKTAKMVIEDKTIHYKRIHPTSILDFVEYFKTRLCVQTL